MPENFPNPSANVRNRVTQSIRAQTTKAWLTEAQQEPKQSKKSSPSKLSNATRSMLDGTSRGVMSAGFTGNDEAKDKDECKDKAVQIDAQALEELISTIIPTADAEDLTQAPFDDFVTDDVLQKEDECASTTMDFIEQFSSIHVMKRSKLLAPLKNATQGVERADHGDLFGYGGPSQMKSHQGGSSDPLTAWTYTFRATTGRSYTTPDLFLLFVDKISCSELSVQKSQRQGLSTA